MEIVLDSNNFETEVVNSDMPVIVDFWAEWCIPCKSMAPLIAELADELKDVKVGKVNIDENRDLAMKYRIMSIPYIALFKNGQIVDKVVGVTDKETILNML